MERKLGQINLLKIVRWVGTVSAVALMIWLMAQQDWRSIWLDVQKVGLARFVLALVFTMLSRFFISLRWYLLLRGAGESISYVDSLKITFAGLFANNFMPSTVGGDVVRLGGAMRARLDAALSAASLVVDRLVGMAGMAVFLSFGLPRLFAYSPSQTTLTDAPLVGLAIPVKQSPPIQKLFTRLLSIARRIWQAAILWLRKPQVLLLSFLATLIHQSFLFGSIWVILSGMGDSISFWLVGGLWSMVYFVTLVPISINGFGVQELSIAFAFHNLGDVSEPHSLTLALLYRTLMMVASLPGTFFLPQMIAGKQAQSDQDETESRAI